MSGHRRVPRPTRDEPLLPAGLALSLHAVSTVIAGVFGGGMLSAALAGNGICLVDAHDAITILIQVGQQPADPAAAWPHDPRPGPAWLTWLCIMAVATGWCVIIGLLASAIDRRRRNRHRDGIATVTDLRHSGLDARCATRKARKEFPKLAAQHRRRPCSRRTRRRR